MDARLGTLRLDQADVDFGEVDVLGVLVQLRPAGAAGDVLHLGNLHQQPLDPPGDPVRFLHADARRGHRRDGQRTFVEPRQELAAHPEDARHRKQHENGYRRQHGRAVPQGEVQQVGVGPFEPAEQERVVLLLEEVLLEEQVRSQHRRHRQRHDQRRQAAWSGRPSPAEQTSGLPARPARTAEARPAPRSTWRRRCCCGLRTRRGRSP